MNLYYDPTAIKIITKQKQLQEIKSVNILPNDIITFTLRLYLQENKQVDVIKFKTFNT